MRKPRTGIKIDIPPRLNQNPLLGRASVFSAPFNLVQKPFLDTKDSSSVFFVFAVEGGAHSRRLQEISLFSLLGWSIWAALDFPRLVAASF